MKRFRVTWHSDARSELAQIWLAAADRAAVSDAANRIDVVLSDAPEDAGDDFYGDRILVERPLAVTFTVSVDDRWVQVLQVSYRSDVDPRTSSGA